MNRTKKKYFNRFWNLLAASPIIIGSILLIMIGLRLSAQQVGVGEWRFHTPFNRAIEIADTGTRVYCASSHGIYYYIKEDNSLNRLTKVNGLSDINITTLNYSVKNEVLLVGYANGNIDLIRDDNIYNMADIKRKTNISGSKKINNFYLVDEIAYLACDFGIVVLDMLKKEIKDAYTIGANGDESVMQVAINNNKIYAGTKTGVFFAAENSNRLSDKNEWEKEPNLNTSVASLFVFNEILYANHAAESFNGDSLFRFDNNNWTVVSPLLNNNNKSFNVVGNKVYVSHNYSVKLYDKDWNLENTIFYGNARMYPEASVVDAANNSTLWIADGNLGIVKAVNPYNIETFSPSGAYSTRSFTMKYNKGDLWVAAGTTINQGLWQNSYNQDGVFLFRDDKWSVINRSTVENIDSIYDFLAVAVDPKGKDNIFIASHGNGVLAVADKKFQDFYSLDNSSLTVTEVATSEYKWVGVSSVAFDSKGVLWVANSGASNVLCAKDKDGEWYSFSLKAVNSGTTTGHVLITTNDQIWVTFPRGKNKGITVYDYNGTLSDISDDKMVGISNNEGEGSLPSNFILSIAEDLDGAIWVGTIEGIGIFRNPRNIFSEPVSNADKPLVEQDGYNEYLFESQRVTAIAVDGANRKWIGTSGAGVFLMSENGEEELLHFSAENSPLLSNIISTIGINQATGEVFFGTEEGICSYRGTATEGNSDFSSIYAFPNPVEPDYTGPIAIKGLVANSSIKITDISGNLVYETVADGGQTTWNGLNSNGNRVATGVYLVFCSSPDGKTKATTKILFIN